MSTRYTAVIAEVGNVPINAPYFCLSVMSSFYHKNASTCTSETSILELLAINLTSHAAITLVSSQLWGHRISVKALFLIE